MGCFGSTDNNDLDRSNSSKHSFNASNDWKQERDFVDARDTSSFEDNDDKIYDEINTSSEIVDVIDDKKDSNSSNDDEYLKDTMEGVPVFKTTSFPCVDLSVVNDSEKMSDSLFVSIQQSNNDDEDKFEEFDDNFFENSTVLQSKDRAIINSQMTIIDSFCPPVFSGLHIFSSPNFPKLCDLFVEIFEIFDIFENFGIVLSVVDDLLFDVEAISLDEMEQPKNNNKQLQPEQVIISTPDSFQDDIPVFSIDLSDTFKEEEFEADTNPVPLTPPQLIVSGKDLSNHLPAFTPSPLSDNGKTIFLNDHEPFIVSVSLFDEKMDKSNTNKKKKGHSKQDKIPSDFGSSLKTFPFKRLKKEKIRENSSKHVGASLLSSKKNVIPKSPTYVVSPKSNNIKQSLSPIIKNKEKQPKIRGSYSEIHQNRLKTSTILQQKTKIKRKHINKHETKVVNVVFSSTDTETKADSSHIHEKDEFPLKSKPMFNKITTQKSTLPNPLFVTQSFDSVLDEALEWQNFHNH
eukprot:TRINITY_DN2353_c0_g1_i1.p1 TRINITY_DN2353_c0_g1~~TRINITY_DN2353_c0_g1_i1.p1  ORF type:complete len:516 (-),score=186.00 TRINITY_DN2353_c0_g1_i1:72-1619(-)